MKFRDYYEVMGIPRNATQDEVKRAYRKLARKFHPDVSKEKDAEEHFKAVGEAYEVLKDPEKRAAYDRLGSQWQAGQDFRPPPDWDAGFEFSGGGFTGAHAGEFSDFFESLFGAGGPFGTRRQQAHGYSLRGEDHHAKILISLADAYHGTERAIELRIPKIDANGHVVLANRTLNVKIPKGIMAGQRIRLAGQGAPGAGGGPNGDLFLEIEFAPHPLFECEGRDIFLSLPVTPWEAALGANIQVPTLEGKVTLKIPPNSQTNKKLRLKGRGFPGSPPGDQYVTLKIMTPPSHSPVAEELYKKMADELPYNPRLDMENLSGAA